MNIDVGRKIKVIHNDGTIYVGTLANVMIGRDIQNPMNASILINNISDHKDIKSIHLFCHEMKDIIVIAEPFQSRKHFVYVLLSNGKIVDWYKRTDDFVSLSNGKIYLYKDIDELHAFIISNLRMEIERDKLTWEMSDFMVSSYEEEELFYKKWSNEWLSKWEYIDGYCHTKYDK